MTAFTELSPSTPIMTFIRPDRATLVSANDSQIECLVNIQELIAHIRQLKPAVHDDVMENLKEAREHNFKDRLPKFSERGYILGARDEFLKARICVCAGKVPVESSKHSTSMCLTSGIFVPERSVQFTAQGRNTTATLL